MFLLSNLYTYCASAHETVCCPFLGNFCQAFLWQTINNGTNWQLKMRSECIPFKWKTATYFKINLLKSAFKSRFGSFCFRRRMFNDYLMTVWWLPDECLMNAWWLHDECLMNFWWLHEDCLRTASWLPGDCLKNSHQTAWLMPDDCLITLRWPSDDCPLTVLNNFEESYWLVKHFLDLTFWEYWIAHFK